MMNMNKSFLVTFLLVIACFSVFIGSALNMLHILHELGVDSIFTNINLSDEAKIHISLHLTISSISFGLLAFGVIFIWKGLTSQAGLLAALGGIFQTSFLISAHIFGFVLPFIGISASALGIIFSLSSAMGGFSYSSAQTFRVHFMSPYEIAASSLFSALTAVITIITGALVPSPTGGYAHIGDMIIFVAALLLGRKIGGITGIVGSVVADFWLAYPRWYVSILAHGLEGFIAGFGKDRSIVVQVALCAFAGFVMASTYFFINVFIKGYPLAIISFARDLFGQAGISLILAVIINRSLQKARLLSR